MATAFAKRHRAITAVICTFAFAGLAACSAPGPTTAVGTSESGEQEATNITTVARAAQISARGHVSANLPSVNPEVLLPAPKPEQGADYQRIITLDRAGALSRVVYSLGLGNRLVGRDLASDFPAVKDLPNLTPGGHSINAEAVIKLRPEIVITDGTIGPSRVFDTLEKSGVTVVRVGAERTPETIGSLIDEVSAALGLSNQARVVKERIGQELADATEYAQAKADGRRMMVLYVRGTGVAMIAGPESGGRSLITRLGGVDAGENVGITGAFTPITPEALIAAAPETIIVMSGGLESVGGVDGLLEIPGIAQTPAGKNRSILDVPDSQLLSFGAQTPTTLRAMADALYGKK